MDILKVFGTNVANFRKQKNLSQEKLAELSNLHRTYISGIERCGRNVSLENVQRIADALEIETYKLLVEHKVLNQNKVQKRKIISTND